MLFFFVFLTKTNVENIYRLIQTLSFAFMCMYKSRQSKTLKTITFYQIDIDSFYEFVSFSNIYQTSTNLYINHDLEQGRRNFDLVSEK